MEEEENAFHRTTIELYGKLPNQDFVILNIGGKKFHTLRSTLRQFPYSRLAILFADDHVYFTSGQHKSECFFDRSPDIFKHILQCYRNGSGGENNKILENPPTPKISYSEWNQELQYWGIHRYTNERW